MPEIKKVKITLRELNNITGSLSKILNQDMPVKISYRLSKLAKAVQAEMKDFNEQREKLIKKHGERDEQGNLRVTTKTEEFYAELNPVMDEEVELSCIPVTLDDLDGVNLSAIDMANLEHFIEEGETKEG